MNTNYGPRIVESKPLLRWARELLSLAIRGALPLGAVFAILYGACLALNAFAAGMTPGIYYPATDVIASLAMPALYGCIIGALRGIDRNESPWRLMWEHAARAYRNAWLRMVIMGTPVVLIDMVFTSLASTAPTDPLSPAANAMLLIVTVLVWRIPMSNIHGILGWTSGERLYRDVQMTASAFAKNGWSLVIFVLVFCLAAIACPFHLLALPVLCALLILALAYEYIAYRDIFEHQDGNRRRLASEARSPERGHSFQ